MTEPAKTPGQIAYEAYERNFGRDGIDWNDPFLENFRNGWEQAVQDISAPLIQRIAELEAESESLKELITELRESLGDLYRRADTTCSEDCDIHAIMKRADAVIE